MSSQDQSNQEPVGAPEGWPDGESPLRTEPVAVVDEGMKGTGELLMIVGMVAGIVGVLGYRASEAKSNS